MNQPVSTIRGSLLLQKAQELCNEVKALGAAMLAAVEKGEAEHLAALRQTHETAMLQLTRDVRFLQWKEAEAGTEALLRSRATVFERYRHYKRILGADDSDIDALKSVDLIRNELTEETFDTAYGELVAGYAKPLPREQYRKESSVGGLMEFAGNAVVSAIGGQLGKTLPLEQERERGAQHLPPDRRRVRDRRRCAEDRRSAPRAHSPVRRARPSRSVSAPRSGSAASSCRRRRTTAARARR